MSTFTPARLRELADSLRESWTKLSHERAVTNSQCEKALRFAAEQGEELVSLKRKWDTGDHRT